MPCVASEVLLAAGGRPLFNKATALGDETSVEAGLVRFAC